MFIEINNSISPYVVLLILVFGCKNKEEAKKYIKPGVTLSKNYYKGGEVMIYSKFMERLYNKNNIDYELTEIVSENVYKTWDCLSGIFNVQINERMKLVARPNGVTLNNKCIIMVEDYIFRYNNKIEELKIILLLKMAVWKAKKGIYHIRELKINIIIDFDDFQWQNILREIRSWAETV